MVIFVANFFSINEVVACPSQVKNLPQDLGVVDGYSSTLLHITGAAIDGEAINHTGTIREVFAPLDAEDNRFKDSDLIPIEQRAPVYNQLSKVDKFAEPYTTTVLLADLEGMM